MRQLPILITTMVLAITFGFVNHALAFNLSWGKGVTIVPVAQTTSGADIPTPQFFKATAGKTSDKAPSPLHVIQPQANPANAAVETVRTPATPIAPHLNGPELFLLKRVQTLAKHR